MVHISPTFSLMKHVYTSGGIYKVTKEQVGHCHLLEHCCQYLKTAAKVGSFLLQNIPWTDNSDGARSEVQVLCKLAGTILSGIKETEIGS